MRCIRAVTAALQSVADDTISPREASDDLAAVYGADSPQLHVFRRQVAAFVADARDRGSDIAAVSVWPALEAACT